MKKIAFKLFAGIIAATALQTSVAQAYGFDRGYDRGGYDRGGYDRGGRGGYDRGRGGYSSECQDAIANVQYCQGQVAQYQALVNGNSCGDNVACKYQQAQALQYTIQQLQKAESQRARACN